MEKIIKKHKDWNLALTRDMPLARYFLVQKSYFLSKKILGFNFGNNGCAIYKKGVADVYRRLDITKESAKFFINIKNKKNYISKIQKLSAKQDKKIKKFIAEYENSKEDKIKKFEEVTELFLNFWYLSAFPLLIDMALKSIEREDVFRKYKKEIMRLRFATQDVMLELEQLIDRVLLDIAKEKKLDKKCLFFSLPEEIMGGKINCKKALQRYGYSAVFCNESNEVKISQNSREIKQVEKYLDSLIDLGNPTSLKGMTAYSGIVQGKARVILNKSDLKNLKKGEILVTPMTEIDYVPYLDKVSAIVTNEGGMTCHAAIISRELEIPCIIGTKNATKVLNTGDKLEVDAKKGIVKILKK